MKKTLMLLMLHASIAASTIHAYTVYNAPFAFERRYNSNSFIFNAKKYYRKYVPKKQTLGIDAIKKIQEKKSRPVAG